MSERILVLTLILSVGLFGPALADTDKVEFNEATALYLNNFFGSFAAPKIIKKSGKKTLEVWEPYYRYMDSLNRQHGMVTPPIIAYVLDVEYDQIWIEENRANASIVTVYWKGDKIQAIELKEEYISNPLTNEPFPPSYKVTNLFHREYVLRRLFGDNSAFQILEKEREGK